MHRHDGITPARWRRIVAAAGSTVIATLAWIGIASEAMTSFDFSKRVGRTGLMSLLFFYRYFTNQAITFLACIMTLTALRIALSRDLLNGRIYAAILVYVAVMGTVYEALLRRLWSPSGFWLYRDALMHDVLPILTLMFWIVSAPKRSLRWRDALVWLSYPATYCLITLVVGRLANSYPYPFLKPESSGLVPFLLHVFGLTTAFYIYGLVVIALSRLAH